MEALPADIEAPAPAPAIAATRSTKCPAILTVTAALCTSLGGLMAALLDASRARTPRCSRRARAPRAKSGSRSTAEIPAFRRLHTIDGAAVSLVVEQPLCVCGRHRHGRTERQATCQVSLFGIWCYSIIQSIKGRTVALQSCRPLCVKRRSGMYTCM